MSDDNRSVVDALGEMLEAHSLCTWEQVGLCVYCKGHGVRLYQGSLPDDRRTVPICASDEHDWDNDMGQGYYFVCSVCGFVEWAED